MSKGTRQLRFQDAASTGDTTTDCTMEYAARISDLRVMAPDEELELDQDSANQFISFLKNAPFNIRRAAIGLGVYGELNAVWVSEDRDYKLSIEFYANGEIKYAWLPLDGTVEIDRVSPETFWSMYRDRLRHFLA